MYIYIYHHHLFIHMFSSHFILCHTIPHDFKIINSFIEIHHDLSSTCFHHHFITWITAVDWNPVMSCRCLATFQDGSGGSCRDVGIVAGTALRSGVEWPGMTTVTNSWLLRPWPICSGFSHEKWWFSHSFLYVYLRVYTRISNCNVGLSGSTSGKNSGHVEPTRMGFLSQSLVVKHIRMSAAVVRSK